MTFASAATTTRVIALVPARAGSKGVPGKNLRMLGGVPLLVHTLRTALATTSIGRAIVSTDSVEIAEVARQHGADVPFMRPAEFAQDDTPMVDVVRHAIETLGVREHRPEVIVLLQPTVPFRATDGIDAAVTMLDDSDLDAVVSVVAVPSSHNAAWQLRLNDGRLERADGAPLASLVARRQALEPTYVRDGAIYAFKRAAFLRTGSIYGTRTGAIVSDAPSINIDSWDDWHQAEAFVAGRPAR